jgi:hypothetical protein
MSQLGLWADMPGRQRDDQLAVKRRGRLAVTIGPPFGARTMESPRWSLHLNHALLGLADPYSVFIRDIDALVSSVSGMNFGADPVLICCNSGTKPVDSVNSEGTFRPTAFANSPTK